MALMTAAFKNFTGTAAPLALANVDTDKIIPARFLKTVTRDGLARGLFYSLRFSSDGVERDEFILNRDPWRRASILIALENFGCGSSREHAPWALMDFGIRCIIAPSFADIFYSNCFRNGILPITIDKRACAMLLDDASDPLSALMSISLEEQIICRFNGEIIRFLIDADRKRQLSLGLDEIESTLSRLADIVAYEAASLPIARPRVPTTVGDEAAPSR
jgi:3-isopropylmalate/(R)-2-methylmalate dehydratase small subunit